jgi:UDP-N-acetyl-2-amino-2-deoxyglucuronate dehydrogenase
MSALNGRKIRFGIIGCGRIAAKHFEAIARHGEHAELVAVCDTSPTALRDAVAATGARGYAARAVCIPRRPSQSRAPAVTS